MSIFFHRWYIKGVCHAHILSKAIKVVSYPWKFPSTLPMQGAGEGILFMWFGVLLVSIYKVNFHGGINGSICPTVGIKCKDLYRSTSPISVY